MKGKNIYNVLNILVILGFVVASCVPARQFEDVKAKKEQCEAERSELKKQNETLQTENNELKSKIDRLMIDQNALIADTTIKGKAYRTLTVQYDKINELYQQLLANQEKLRQGADVETQKAMALLQKAREDLQLKEDELRALEARLNQERANLEEMRIKNELKEKELAEKDERVKVLEAKLNAQDSALNALRKKVSEALVGFEGNGLTVSHKNGKVYVSLDEKLLFKSGRWDVDPKGIDALKKLSKVLEQNPDINIMIEGHTDDVPYNGNGNIEDNWDLSVKRATSIVKIILNNSNIDPVRLTAAGRSQYLPVDPAKTSEARAKNRRTEIILTPKLDILYDIMK